jgi:hypothetical protein
MVKQIWRLQIVFSFGSREEIRNENIEEPQIQYVKYPDNLWRLGMLLVIFYMRPA